MRLAIIGIAVVVGSAAPAFAQDDDIERDESGRPIFKPHIDPSQVDLDLAERLDRIRREYAHDPEAQRVLGPLARFYRTGDSRDEVEFEFANVGYGARKARQLARTMPPSPNTPDDVPRFLRQMDAYRAWKQRPLRQKIADGVRSLFRGGRR